MTSDDLPVIRAGRLVEFISGEALTDVLTVG